MSETTKVGTPSSKDFENYLSNAVAICNKETGDDNMMIGVLIGSLKKLYENASEKDRTTVIVAISTYMSYKGII